MIEFRFENLKIDGTALETDWDLLLRPVAEFSIVVPPAPIPLYREEEFCVVEFAIHITQWLVRVRNDAIDFSYNSVESDETDLVSIRKAQDLWTVAALNQDYIEDRLFAIEDIDRAVRAFVTRLIEEMQRKFRQDVSHLVSGRPMAL